MGRTIAVANQKGGVAKTTTVAALCAALGERGHRVLAVDLDPQACLTFSLGFDPDKLQPTIHDVFVGRSSGALDGRGRRRHDSIVAHRGGKPRGRSRVAHLP